MDLGNYIPAIKYGHVVDNDELNPALVQTKTVTLTAANIIAMGTTPVQLVTPTTPGTAIIVESAVFEMNPTSTVFTIGGASNLIFSYNSVTTTGNVMAQNVPQSVITSTTAGYYALEATTGAGGLVVLPNAGITISNGNNLNFATGTGTAKVMINYYIVTI